jgi:capsular exopolysaccharide synthesis family protein
MAAFRRRLPTALVLATLGACGVVVLILEVVPAQYSAEALLQVTGRSPVQRLIGEDEPAPDLATIKGNHESIIRSLPVLNAALSRPEVRSLPRVQEQISPSNWLAKALKVEFKGPGMVEIRMSGLDPEEVQKLVNAVADEYRNFVNKQEETRLRALQEQLEKNLREGEASLRDKQRLLHDLLQRSDQDEPDAARAKYESAVRQLEDAKKEARVLGGEEVSLQNQLKTQKDRSENLTRGGLTDAVLDKFLQDDPVHRQYQIDVAKIDEEIRQAQATLQEDAAARYLENAQRQKEAILKSLAAHRRAVTPRAIEVIQAEATLAAGKLEADLAGIRKRQEFIRGEIRRLDTEARRLSPGNRVVSPEAEALRQEVNLKEDVLKKLGERIETLKATQRVSSVVTLVQRAELPQVLDRARQLKLAGFTGVVVFGFLILGVSLLEFRSRKINNAKDVVEGLGLRLVGTVPALSARVRAPATGGLSAPDQQSLAQVSESVDSIRTMLLHTARTDALQAVMVTSAGPGEGKTSLASQLAASLARAWRKTLLIDADLRHPAMHKVFEQPREPGFSEVLRSEVEVQDVIRPTALSRLWVMTAGHMDNHALQALAQDNVRALMERLKGQYEFIVVDSCPVLPVADSLLLGQHVDAVLLSILREVSRAPAVHAAQQRLDSLGIRSLGAVFVGADQEMGAGSYKYQDKAK